MYPRGTLTQLANAVEALHAAGKLHRDLKPKNVLVDRTGHVTVLDFGLATATSALDSLAELAGTPAYMAPEQAAGEPPTPASDWYAVGVMLYEALSGQRPFDGSALTVLADKRRRDPPAPSTLAAGVPADLEALCLRLLDRRPERRARAAEVAALVDHLATGEAEQRGDAPGSIPPPSPDVFVGRARELSTLEERLSRSARGEGAVVLVSGPSGMGKTALCERALQALESETLVLQGRCHERESVPYKAIDAVVDAIGRELQRHDEQEVARLLPRHTRALARLFPTLDRVPRVASARTPRRLPTDARELRNQGFAALKELLQRLTDRQPVVLFVDDLQWADVDSARLLSHVLGPPDPPSLLFLGAYRSEAVDDSEFLGHLLTDATLAEQRHDVPVGPLPLADAEELSRRLGAGPASAAVARESEGVPFLLTQLAEQVGPPSATDGEDVPRLDLLLAKRIAALPAPARALLEAVAMVGGPIEQAAALEVAGLEDARREALNALGAARLVRTQGARPRDVVDVYHDRVREAVRATMPARQTRDAHRGLATTLAVWAPDDPERLVEHYTGAGDHERACHQALKAATSAANPARLQPRRRALRARHRAVARRRDQPGGAPRATRRRAGQRGQGRRSGGGLLAGGERRPWRGRRAGPSPPTPGCNPAAARRSPRGRSQADEGHPARGGYRLSRVDPRRRRCSDLESRHRSLSAPGQGTPRLGRAPPEDGSARGSIP